MDALVAIDLPVVLLPYDHLKKVLSYTKSIPTLLSPEYVRTFILERKAAAHKACSGKAQFTAALLEFCLRDIDDTQPNALVSSTFQSCLS